MIKLHCRTNLDLFREVWPTLFSSVPRVGDLVCSRTDHNGFQLRLEVFRVTWNSSCIEDSAHPELELHIPKSKDMSLLQFYQWYAPLVGQSVGSFIEEKKED